jgi:hypothetical protein
MFNKKINNLIARVAWLEKRLELTEKVQIATPIYEFSDCEICGCMVRKKNAVKGKSELKEDTDFWHKQEYIFTPYYCKLCAPKGRKCSI